MTGYIGLSGVEPSILVNSLVYSFLPSLPFSWSSMSGLHLNILLMLIFAMWLALPKEMWTEVSMCQFWAKALRDMACFYWFLLGFCCCHKKNMACVNTDETDLIHRTAWSQGQLISAKTSTTTDNPETYESEVYDYCFKPLSLGWFIIWPDWDHGWLIHWAKSAKQTLLSPCGLKKTSGCLYTIGRQKLARDMLKEKSMANLTSHPC